MDNLTHALLGASLAEIALVRAAAPGPARRVFLAAGVIASNLPDLDLVYTGITPAPLGYLLHHRGPTHTAGGLIAQAAAVALVCLLPPLRRAIDTGGRGRFAALIAVSLALHVVLDSWNTYGVHPFWPAGSRWLYGDAVFIFEPWLWLFLGLAAAGNARARWARVALAALIASLFVALAVVGILPVPAVIALTVAGAGLGWMGRSLAPPVRAASALAAGATFVAMMFGLSATARGQVQALYPPGGRAIVEVVVNPSPGWPVCWDVIAIERDGPDLLLRRGTLSLAPSRYAPARCPVHLIERRGPSPPGAALAWGEEIRQPIASLRDLARRDCWTRSWLQFGRVPFVRDGTIADLRFENRGRGNFTAMAVSGEDRPCPPALTDWDLPRADVLSR